MKPCSCGAPGCSRLGPPGQHEWDPLAEPVDDCGFCNGPLDRLPEASPYVRRLGEALEYGPPLRPVRLATGYAHGECV